MSLTATIDAAINAATLNVDQFQEVTFTANYKQASSNYDPVTGIATNTNTAIPIKIILPGAALTEIDGESVKVTALEGIILRSWLPGGDIHVDDQISVNTGVFAGDYIVSTAPVSTVAHWELALSR